MLISVHHRDTTGCNPAHRDTTDFNTGGLFDVRKQYSTMLSTWWIEQLSMTTTDISFVLSYDW